MVVLGIAAPPSSSPSFEGAAYSPATDEWLALATASSLPGHDLADLKVAWAGDRLVAWLLWEHVESHGNGATGMSGADLATYITATRQWQLVSGGTPPAPEAPPIWTGHDLIVPVTNGWQMGGGGHPPGSGTAYRYDPMTGATRDLPRGPADDSLGPTFLDGTTLLHFSETLVGPSLPRAAAALDLTVGRWVSLPPAPRPLTSDSVAVWTGTSAIFWGGSVPPGMTPTTGGLEFVT
jgi:hypothetical protein